MVSVTRKFSRPYENSVTGDPTRLSSVAGHLEPASAFRVVFRRWLVMESPEREMVSKLPVTRPSRDVRQRAPQNQTHIERGNHLAFEQVV